MTPPPRWPQVSLPAMEDQAAFGTVAKHTIAAKNAAVTATRCAIMCSCGRQEGRWGIAGPDNELSAELFARLRFKPVLFECFWEAYCESCTTWTASKCASLFYRSISVQTQKEKNLFFLFLKTKRVWILVYHQTLETPFKPALSSSVQTVPLQCLLPTLTQSRILFILQLKAGNHDNRADVYTWRPLAETSDVTQTQH